MRLVRTEIGDRLAEIHRSFHRTGPFLDFASTLFAPTAFDVQSMRNECRMIGPGGRFMQGSVRHLLPVPLVPGEGWSFGWKCLPLLRHTCLPGGDNHHRDPEQDREA